MDGSEMGRLVALRATRMLISYLMGCSR